MGQLHLLVQAAFLEIARTSITDNRYVVELERNEKVDRDRVRDLVIDIGSSQEQAQYLLDRLYATGRTTIVAGPWSGCEEAAKLFDELGMQTRIRPLQDKPPLRCRHGKMDRFGQVCCDANCWYCVPINEGCPFNDLATFTSEQSPEWAEVNEYYSAVAQACCGDMMVRSCNSEDGPSPCVDSLLTPYTEPARASVKPGTHCQLPRPVFLNESDCAVFTSEKECRNARRKRYWLASFPGSGNTWLRKLLETATGIVTGSVYYDDHLRATEFLGEGVNRSSLVLGVKTHAPIRGLFTDLAIPSDGQALLLIRNPLQAAKSYTSFILSGEEHDRQIREDLMNARFDSWLGLLLNVWRSHTQFYVRSFNRSKLLIKFEDFAADPSETVLRRILPWMGIDPAAAGLKERLMCMTDALKQDWSKGKGIRRLASYRPMDGMVCRTTEGAQELVASWLLDVLSSRRASWTFHNAEVISKWVSG
eukprot:TRINITY_DN56214_c0_g1_i1.p1 TRINITY_DN56214_c0_g1~~TRINITY_DN56214_c0_g1_i1.p1  ORF type:complete len:520 (-),score=81.19 TRINITY_DN56214_c0_g1_i1:19-1446(-)